MLGVPGIASSAAVDGISGMPSEAAPSRSSGPLARLDIGTDTASTIMPAAQRPSGMTCARREAGARRPAPSTSADSPRRPEPRPGRFRARLFFFPAIALLLGALSLFHAAPDAAQTVALTG